MPLARHVSKLREIERLYPFEAALCEHLEDRLDALRIIQAAELHENRPREALKVAGERARAARRTVVSIQFLA